MSIHDLYVVQTVLYGQHGFLGPDDSGYFTDLLNAGCYTAEEAGRLCGEQPGRTAVPVVSALQQCAPNTVGAALLTDLTGFGFAAFTPQLFRELQQRLAQYSDGIRLNELPVTCEDQK